MKTQTILILLVITTISNAQSILKIGDVFNFDTGDEFHIKSNLQNQTPNASRLKVIDKYYSLNNDTVFYRIASDNYTSAFYSEPEPHLEYSFTKDTVLNSYTDLDSSIFTYYSNFQYDSLLKNYDSNFTYDSLLGFSAHYCDSLLNGFTCGLGDFEPNVYSYTFGKGLGIIYKYYLEGSSGGASPSTDESLFYYKKQNGECGTPDNTTSIEQTDIADNFKIYPNPVCQILNIQFDSHESVVLRLFDIKGSLHLEKIIVNSDLIDISNFNTGVYLINLQLQDGQINRKIIIQ